MKKDIEELLPFYVNGTLSKEERLQVTEALEDDPSLEDEIAFLEKLREEIQEQSMEYSSGELGLKRLQKSIADEALQKDPIALSRSKITKEQNWGWRAAAIAACFLLMMQTVVMLPMWKDSDLGAAGGKVLLQSSGKIISVTFVPDAREENIRNLLLTLDATIVDGPSALGVYKLSIPKDAESAVEKLRAHKTLVETADIEGRKAGQ